MNLFRGNFLNNTYPAGNYSFNPSQTGGPRADTPAAGSGFAMASFLLGVVNGGSVETDSAVSVQNLYGGVFVHDDFRVTSRLTLNLGLRWEYQTPVTERYNRTTRGFAYNTPSPLQVPGFNLTGGLLYAGVNGQPRGLYNPDYNNWGPRIGLAYSLNSRTVIRAGYSLSYIPVVGAVSATGYSNTTSMVATQNGGITPYNVLSNPFPTGQLPFIGNSQGLATLIGQNITFVNPSDRTPKFHNWHFDLQREIAARTVVTASYVGSRAYDLFAQTNDFVSAINQNVNQFNPQYLSLGTALLATVPNPFYGIITSGSLAGTTIAESQLLKPYPQYSGVSRLAPGYGNSHYESAQFQLEKRTSNGVTALVSYTIAKNITDLNNPTNVYNRQAARSLASFDSPQRLAISVTWDVPFGQGRHFGTHAPRALDFVAGGWALSSFQLFQAGFPLAFSLAKSAAGSGSGVPNAIGDPSQGVSGVIEARLHHYFNTAAFAQPPDFTFGNVSPYIGTVRAPGMNNIDASLSKVFLATEKVNVLFRATSFNFLNHPVFSAPNTSLGNAAFGSITSQANVSRQMEFTAKILF